MSEYTQGLFDIQDEGSQYLASKVQLEVGVSRRETWSLIFVPEQAENR